MTHVPERTCVACRKKRPQGELLRLTQLQGGWAVQNRQRTGRGVYLCADSPECWQEKKLRRTFRAQAAAVAQQLGRLAEHPAPPAQHAPPAQYSKHKSNMGQPMSD